MFHALVGWEGLAPVDGGICAAGPAGVIAVPFSCFEAAIGLAVPSVVVVFLASHWSVIPPATALVFDCILYN